MRRARPRMSAARTMALVALVASTLSAWRMTAVGEDDSRPRPPLQLRAAKVLFLKEVQPLLERRCLGCHGGGPDLEANLDLRSREKMLAGGDSGPALVPDKPEDSLIYQAVLRTGDTVMPPEDRNALTKDEILSLNRWIASGAPWAEPDEQEVITSTEWEQAADGGITVSTSGGQSPSWTDRKYRPEDVWAYQPVRRYAVPWEAVDDSNPGNEIDAFIQAKLKEKGLASAALADKRTLINRVTWDLTGLPPTSEEIAVYLSDDSPQAYEKLVDRLLDSPRYGEQRARHWLDVVRYADTAGFSNDFERPNAWRYRDYVIRSFNDDKPYDRFVVEQIAGDELDDQDPDMLTAVGFLRMGPWEHTAMSVAAVTRQLFLDDVTNSVGVTFLGQGMRCCRCHDHKFDPLPTRDYYRLQAVFAPLQFADRPVPFQQGENIAGFESGKVQSQRRLDDANELVAALYKSSNRNVKEYLKQRGVKRIEDLPKDEQGEARSVGLSKTEKSVAKVYNKRKEYFIRELIRYEPFVFSVYSGPPNQYVSNQPRHPIPPQDELTGAVPAVHVLTGGALETPGEEVPPGVLSAVFGSNDTALPTAWNTVPASTQGRRLALAQWIASPQNTLTARVYANRIWQQHFAGKGLVATPNNFGKMGARPTHPELLDFLATWFIEHGWSTKKLARLIVTSAAYRQSSAHPNMDRLKDIDPNNDLLAYHPTRRLAAEEIRDGLLAISGELDFTMGGPGVFPDINREVAMQPRHIMGSVAPAYQASATPAERNRRTIYAFRYRTLSDPMLDVFNRPNTEVSCERRDQTTVTPQVFALFNGEFVHDRALALAHRTAIQNQSPSERVAAAFRAVYGREPTEDELSLALDHVREMAGYHRTHDAIPVPLPTSVQREMVEEMTGELFQWDEELDLMKDYQPNLKPWDVNAKVRGLAELCLVLMNSNEYLYVR